MTGSTNASPSESKKTSVQPWISNRLKNANERKARLESAEALVEQQSAALRKAQKKISNITGRSTKHTGKGCGGNGQHPNTLKNLNTDEAAMVHSPEEMARRRGQNQRPPIRALDWSSLVQRTKTKYGERMVYEHPEYGRIDGIEELALLQLFDGLKAGNRWAVESALAYGLGKPKQSTVATVEHTSHVELAWPAATHQVTEVHEEPGTTRSGAVHAAPILDIQAETIGDPGPP